VANSAIYSIDSNDIFANTPLCYVINHL